MTARRDAQAIINEIIRRRMIPSYRFHSPEKTKHVNAARMEVILALHKAGLFDSEIATLLDRDRSTISYHIRRLTQRPRKW